MSSLLIMILCVQYFVMPHLLCGCMCLWLWYGVVKVGSSLEETW